MNRLKQFFIKKDIDDPITPEVSKEEKLFEEEMSLRRTIIAHRYDTLTDISTNPNLSKINDMLLDYRIGDCAGIELSKSIWPIEKSRAIAFLNGNYYMNRIPYVNERVFLRFKEHASMIVTVNEYNRIGKEISPFRLPVKLDREGLYEGYTCYLLDITDDDLFLSNMKIFFNSISLAKEVTNLTGGVYTHELIHTQVDNKYSITDSADNEVLSLFNEMLYFYNAYGYRFYKYWELQRVQITREYVEALLNEELGPKTPIILSEYIISFFKASKLFEIYYKGDEKIRVEMIARIQLVFDHMITVEDFLLMYDIDTPLALDTSVISNSLAL